MNFELNHLAGDVLGLPRFSREIYSGEPGTHGILLPRRVEETPRFEETLERDERQALVETLAQQLAAYSPHVAVLDSLHRLEQPAASVVLGTAPLGLLGGPLAANYIALQTVRAAHQLSESWGEFVVPLLWIDSDPQAPNETVATQIRSQDFQLERVRLPLHAVHEEVVSCHDYLAHQFHGAPYLEPELRRTLPRKGETLGEAQARATLELLGLTGLIVVLPAWLRADSAHFLASILSQDPVAHVQRAQAEFKLLQFNSTDIEPGSSSAYATRIAGSKPEPLQPGGDGFHYLDEPGSRTCAELAAEIVQAPERFVPGERLLPLVQDHMFPVAARITPREALIHEACLASLRKALETPRVPLLPQLTCTLTDEPLRNALGRLGRTLEEACRAQHEPPPEIPLAELHGHIHALRELAGESVNRTRELSRPLWAFDPVLRTVSRRASRDMRKALEKLIIKAERVLNNRGGKIGRQRRVVSTTLFPNEQPQHQSDPVFVWSVRYGTEWLLELAPELEPFGWEHLVLDFP